MRISSFRRLALGCLALTAATIASAADPLVDANGELTGATGVNINGTLYDVRFVVGTCASVFGVCDAAHFDFHDLNSAIAAANALFDQVFLDGSSGDFDSHPELTSGCADPTVCYAYIPYDLLTEDTSNFEVAAAANYPQYDYWVHGAVLSSFDLSSTPSAVFVRFIPSQVSGVPEPSTWAMMLLGFGAIGSMLRRRKIRSPLPQLA